MPANKRPKRKRILAYYPKAIKIVEEDNEFRLFKVWNGNKVSKDPFAVTDNLEDLIEVYKESCEKFGVKPKIKEIRELINHQQQTKVSNEEANFFKSYYN